MNASGSLRRIVRRLLDHLMIVGREGRVAKIGHTHHVLIHTDSTQTNPDIVSVLDTYGQSEVLFSK